MNDLLRAVLLTMAVPGFIVGALYGIRGGWMAMITNAIAGGLGGIGGGLVLGGFATYLKWSAPVNGPVGIVVGSIVGATICLLAISALRRR